MVLSQKIINIIMDPTKKSLAFSGLVTQEDMIILRSNGWIPNGEPKVLKSGRILHLWERSKPAASFGASSESVGVTNMESIASALGGIKTEMEFEEKLNDINEQIGRMGGGMGGGMGGRRKSRKQKKSKKYRKSKRSKKSRKSIKRRR
jgi:hypothetical protein